MLTPPIQFEKLQNFQEVFQKGKKFKTSTSQIVFWVEKNPEQITRVQVGLIALKKIVGKKAVSRNKAKRRFKHGFLSQLTTLSLPPGFTVKIVALTNKNTITYDWDVVVADIGKEMSHIKNQILAPLKEITHEKGAQPGEQASKHDG